MAIMHVTLDDDMPLSKLYGRKIRQMKAFRVAKAASSLACCAHFVHLPVLSFKLGHACNYWAVTHNLERLARMWSTPDHTLHIHIMS